MRAVNDYCEAVPESTVYLRHAPLDTEESNTPVKNMVEAIKKWKGRSEQEKRTGMFH
ncbi:uncharacterized protein LOC142337044 [Convolutriloba macropyga]